MSEPPAPYDLDPPSTAALMRDVPAAVWLLIAAVLVAAAIVVHTVFPRYEFHVVENGRAMLVYDRWANRFQRINYDDAGEPTATRVVTPF